MVRLSGNGPSLFLNNQLKSMYSIPACASMDLNVVFMQINHGMFQETSDIYHAFGSAINDSKADLLWHIPLIDASDTNIV